MNQDTRTQVKMLAHLHPTGGRLIYIREGELPAEGYVRLPQLDTHIEVETPLEHARKNLQVALERGLNEYSERYPVKLEGVVEFQATVTSINGLYNVIVNPGKAK